MRSSAHAPPPRTVPRLKYYNNTLFYNVQKDFLVQAGDPTGTGQGGDSVFARLYGDQARGAGAGGGRDRPGGASGERTRALSVRPLALARNTPPPLTHRPRPPPPQARFFDDEITPKLKHGAVGTVGYASTGPNRNASAFYITSRAGVDALDGRRTVFGCVVEGLDVVARLNEAFCDEKGRPWVNTRVHHTVVLDDPFPDPPGLGPLVPEGSPPPPEAGGEDGRLEDGWQPGGEGVDPEEAEKARKGGAGTVGGGDAARAQRHSRAHAPARPPSLARSLSRVRFTPPPTPAHPALPNPCSRRARRRRGARRPSPGRLFWR